MELTREAILAMPAGRELDALVAEHAMGRKPKFVDVVIGHRGDVPLTKQTLILEDYSVARDGINLWISDWPANIVPAYSTDIVAAWQVVQRMRQDGYLLRLNDCAGRSWEARFYRRRPDTTEIYYLHAFTVPHAICRAALSAVLP